MLSLRLTSAVAAVALGSYAADGAQSLGVLRVSPTGQDVKPTAVVEITFDRPVAGSLDRTVDPAAIFSVQPAVAGELEWRDPVTIRFTPAEPLPAARTYVITVSNDFTAMDGSRLDEPYRHEFRVPGPRVLGGDPVGPNNRPRFLDRDAVFEVVLSWEGDVTLLEQRARVMFTATCQGTRRIGLRVAGTRPTDEDDPYPLRYPGGWHPPEEQDLFRIVRLEPVEPLPLDCQGALMMPVSLDPGESQVRPWQLATRGPFRLVAARCPWRPFCPTGGIELEFSTPVRGEELAAAVRVAPQVESEAPDPEGESHLWRLDADLSPRRQYTVEIDRSLRDVFGAPLIGANTSSFSTTGYAPSVDYPAGKLVVERNALRTLAVQHVNIDSLVVEYAPVPRDQERYVLGRSWGLEGVWSQLDSQITRTVPTPGPLDQPTVTTVRMPAFNAQRAGAPTLVGVRVRGVARNPDPRNRGTPPVAFVQVTNLAVYARIGATEGVVWVTGADDGLPRSGAEITLYDTEGRVRATGRSDLNGLAYLRHFRRDSASADPYGYQSYEGYLGVVLGDDRALVGVSQSDYQLSPWRFNTYPAWGEDRLEAAAAVFTERDIYRPGETMHAKAIARRGPLGSLVPAAGDSLRWTFTDREGETLFDTVVTLSSFGTGDRSLALEPDLALGRYGVAVALHIAGEWRDLARTGYRVAEYRPPEFLVTAVSDTTPQYAGNTLTAEIEARYLFGAPMGRAAVSWTARQTLIGPWELRIPNTDGFYVGAMERWWEAPESSTRVVQLGGGSDTLDLQGHLTLAVPLPAPPEGRAARASVQATVTDINRQSVSSTTSALVHPASFYLATRVEGTGYFWRADEGRTVSVKAVTPGGEVVRDVAVTGRLVRREWHRVRRIRDGRSQLVGEWVMDTVQTCEVTTAREPVACPLTPPAGGSYLVSFSAHDAGGRLAHTSFYRWVTGPDWVPWWDENEFKMDVIADRERYEVGDTATVLFAPPFTDAEAWITVEREALIEQRRLRVESGSFTVKFPIRESYAPNVFVSIVVARGRSAPPGETGDPGRPTFRVGYAELRVSPEAKRLTVDVEPVQAEYRPGDTASVRLHVADRAGGPARAEVALWAVDEGVLALTGYRVPDPIDLLYSPRGLGLRLASNLIVVAEQLVADEQATVAKGADPGGGGGEDLASILRSRFRSTAFFLGSVVTDENGDAVARAHLPDNLTTFRLMAVAVTEGDRYGNGQSSMLVTRPLLARPALPRFVRPGDDFRAGVVVNHRLGGTPTVRASASAEGIALRGDTSTAATLEAGRGTEVRFHFVGEPGDTAQLQFVVRGGGEADAVQTRLAVEPDFYPRSFTVAGLLRDTASAAFELPATVDPDRSRLTIDLGSSPLSVIRAVNRRMRVYPYYCSEQVSSAAIPLIALYRADQAEPGHDLAPAYAREEIEEAVRIVSRRQGPSGGIGMWTADDWTSPWLTTYVGAMLLDARDAGIPVDSAVLAGMADYLTRYLRRAPSAADAISSWYHSQAIRLRDQVAAVDFLSRYGGDYRGAFNTLHRNVAQLTWEDRVRLAQILERDDDRKSAADILRPIWQSVTVAGRKAVLPDTVHAAFYFYSRVRPLGRLLQATLALEPEHVLVGPLVEALVDQGRSGRLSPWNTQDYAAAVNALVAFHQLTRAEAGRTVTVRGRGDTLAQAGHDLETAASSVALTGLLDPEQNEVRRLPLTLSAEGGSGVTYYYLTVEEIPREQPVRPDDEGISVERWYEDYQTGEPIIEVDAGELVRVRLRITVPGTRHFVVVDDPLPGGLEAVDVSLRTVGRLPDTEVDEAERSRTRWSYWTWSPFYHREMRDDRVVFAATTVWSGTYELTYVARATTPGVFVRPPAHAEEMYNPGVHGRTDGGAFTVHAVESGG